MICLLECLSPGQSCVLAASSGGAHASAVRPPKHPLGEAPASLWLLGLEDTSPMPPQRTTVLDDQT